MKHFPIVFVGFTAICMANNAAAQERKFQLALRTGYSLPMGSVASSGSVSYMGYRIPIPSDMKMTDYVSYRVPLWIDAGYMVTPNILLGIYFQYGFVGTKTNNNAPYPLCPSGTSCSAHDMHYGIQAHYYFTPEAAVDPWVGFGIGRESISLATKNNGVSMDMDFSGWTFALLQAGVDFKLTDAFALGPFASFSLGQYSSATLAMQGVSVDADLPKAMHEWLTLGVKGQLGL
jgi:outer membrane protein W